MFSTLSLTLMFKKLFNVNFLWYILGICVSVGNLIRAHKCALLWVCFFDWQVVRSIVVLKKTLSYLTGRDIIGKIQLFCPFYTITESDFESIVCF